MSALDTQVGGDHYKHLAIQPMEYSMKNGLDACQHTAIKYITRFREKGGIADLEKAKHCIDMLIEFEMEHIAKKEVRAVLDGEKTFAEAFTAAEKAVTGEQDPYGPRDAEGWYAWNGDETMRPVGQVDYILRCDEGEKSFTSGTCPADQLRWKHDRIGGDIVKWRPAQ